MKTHMHKWIQKMKFWGDLLKTIHKAINRFNLKTYTQTIT